MIDRADFDQARQVLIAILGGEPGVPVIGLEDLSMHDRLTVMSVCSASILEHAICGLSMYQKEEALRGVDAFVKDMRDNVKRICETRN